MRDIYNLAKLIFCICLLLWAAKAFLVARENCPVNVFFQPELTLEKQLCQLAYGYKYGN